MKDRPQETSGEGEEKKGLWIFGYGSLVWKPGFAYRRSSVGFIRGYKRRFWHGDDFYRGTRQEPARVVTLVEDVEACTWGVAYEVAPSQIEQCLQYLNMREVVLGGYITETVEFIPKEEGQGPHPALVYIATSSNRIYLGPAPEADIAAQIAACTGKAGPNIEYLLRLAEFMRLSCPLVDDPHLFAIEAALLNLFSGSEGTKSHEPSTVLPMYA